MRPGKVDAEVTENIRKVLSGRITHPWVDRFNTRVVSDRRLIKEVRINLFLKWLQERFPGVRIVLLMRHPFAVALSRIRLGWQVNLRSFCKQSDLVEDFLAPYLSEIHRCTSDFEKQVCAWCIQHYVPLIQFKNSEDIYLAFYERFCLNVAQEAGALFSWLKEDSFSTNTGKLSRPSKMTYKQSALKTGQDLTRWWTKVIKEEEMRRGIELLSLFGLDQIYDENPLPKKTFSLDL